MKKVLLKIYEWLFRAIAAIIELIPLIFILVGLVYLVLVFYLKGLFSILSTWLRFIGERKFNHWLSRAWYELVLAHKDVVGMIKGIVS
jgi:hypothetical protein